MENIHFSEMRCKAARRKNLLKSSRKAQIQEVFFVRLYQFILLKEGGFAFICAPVFIALFGDGEERLK